MSTIIHVTDLTKKVTEIYKQHFFDYLRLLVWLLVPAVLSSIVFILPISPLSQRITDGALGTIAALVSLWLSVVLVDLTLSYVKGVTIKKYTAWNMFWRIIDLIMISLLQGAIILFGLLLFIVPGIIFWIWFSFARYAVLIDNKSPGSESLINSKKMALGRFWQIAWRWIGSYVYFGIFFGLIIMATLALIGALFGDPRMAFQFDEKLWWSELIIGVLSTLVTPIFIAVGVVLYEDAKK